MGMLWLKLACLMKGGSCSGGDILSVMTNAATAVASGRTGPDPQR
jgi:hypothetical protein